MPRRSARQLEARLSIRGNAYVEKFSGLGTTHSYFGGVRINRHRLYGSLDQRHRTTRRHYHRGRASDHRYNRLLPDLACAWALDAKKTADDLSSPRASSIDRGLSGLRSLGPAVCGGSCWPPIMCELPSQTRDAYLTPCLTLPVSCIAFRVSYVAIIQGAMVWGGCLRPEHHATLRSNKSRDSSPAPAYTAKRKPAISTMPCRHHGFNGIESNVVAKTVDDCQ